MTNKERILQITDKNKDRRLRKIIAQLHKNYIIQTALPSDSSFPTSDELVNIIVPAKDQTNKIAIMGHWDVFPGSSGFNDNSSGIVTLLKLQDCLPNNVELVFTDGEEHGGTGCQYYLENFPTPKEAINVDVVGLGDKIFYEMYGKVTTFKVPTDAELYSHIPFSDSYILQNYGVPNILLLTGRSKLCLIENIFHAQHCGKDDGKIDMISEDIMDRVFQAIMNIIR